jgi:hypothetical protein
MFNLTSDDVPLAGVGPERCRNGCVIALCCARCEHNIHRVRTDQLGHLLARRGDEGKNRSFAGAQDDTFKGAALDGLPHSVVR